MLTKEQIKDIIPYDDPFLFVDEITEIDEKEIIGQKQLRKDEAYFKGHFVDFPIMPGVLVIEGLAQTATLLLRQKLGSEHKKKHILAYQVRGAYFYKPIFPGDKITYKVRLLGVYDVNPVRKFRRDSNFNSDEAFSNGVKDNKIANFKGEALVEDDLKCEVRFVCAVVDKKEFEEKYKS